MIVTYTPAEGTPQEWVFKPGKLMSPEAEAIERHTGWTYQEFGEKFMAGSALARHALVWVFLKRANAGIRYADVSFAVDEVTIAFDADENAAVVKLLREKEDLTDAERAALQALVEESEVAGVDPKGDPAP